MKKTTFLIKHNRKIKPFVAIKLQWTMWRRNYAMTKNLFCACKLLERTDSWRWLIWQIRALRWRFVVLERTSNHSSNFLLAEKFESPGEPLAKCKISIYVGQINWFAVYFVNATCLQNLYMQINSRETTMCLETRWKLFFKRYVTLVLQIKYMYWRISYQMLCF